MVRLAIANYMVGMDKQGKDSNKCMYVAIVLHK